MAELLEAAKLNDLALVKKLLKKRFGRPNVNTKGAERGETALHWAGVYGNTDLADILISKGANVNAANNSQSTPLHLACYNGHKEVTELLLARNANVHSINDDKVSPLHEACSSGNVTCAEMVLKHGADSTLRDCIGEYPLDKCPESKVQEMEDLFTRSGVAIPKFNPEEEAAAAAEEQKAPEPVAEPKGASPKAAHPAVTRTHEERRRSSSNADMVPHFNAYPTPLPGTVVLSDSEASDQEGGSDSDPALSDGATSKGNSTDKIVTVALASPKGSPKKVASPGSKRARANTPAAGSEAANIRKSQARSRGLTEQVSRTPSRQASVPSFSALKARGQSVSGPGDSAGDEVQITDPELQRNATMMDRLRRRAQAAEVKGREAEAETSQLKAKLWEMTEKTNNLEDEVAKKQEQMAHLEKLQAAGAPAVAIDADDSGNVSVALAEAKERAAASERRALKAEHTSEAVQMKMVEMEKVAMIAGTTDVEEREQLLYRIDEKEMHVYDGSKGDDEKILGGSDHATVHRGLWRGTDVAIKTYNQHNQTQTALFEKESTRRARARPHPNVITTYGHSPAPRFVVVLEMVRGTPLKDVVHALCEDDDEEEGGGGIIDRGEGSDAQKFRCQLTLKRVLKMTRQIASAMAHLVSQGYNHLDLSVHRVLVSYDLKDVKIGGFGITRPSASTKKKKPSVSTGRMRYTAPEVLKSRAFSEKSDVWSFGVSAWEICTREKPYGDLTKEMVAANILSNPKFRLESKETFPAELTELLSDCWLEDPDERPTFSELVVRIGSLLSSLTEEQLASTL